METLKFTKYDIEKAASLITNGEIVAFPTDTVYGLGADAMNEQAVKKIFEAKKRPAGRPLSVLIADKDELNKYAVNVPTEATKLAEKFWPGPLTIVLQRKDLFAPSVTMGKETIGLRMPDDLLALKLIEMSRTPLAAPSANSSGRPSPTQASHVLEDLDGKISAIVDGGETSFGIESTVLDLSDSDRPLILRPGEISKEAIEKVLNKKVDILDEEQTGKHYKPTIPVYGVHSTWAEAIDQLNNQNEKIGLLANDEVVETFKNKVEAVFSLGEPDDIKSANRHFFDGLRTFEHTEATVILAETFKKGDKSLAYMNRLRKATEGKRI